MIVAQSVRHSAAAVLLLLAPLPLNGQSIRGIVSNELTHGPIEGAQVSLLDPDMQVVGSVETGVLGGFSLSAREPGRYYISVRTTGFLASLSEPFELVPAGAYEMIIALAPLDLAGVSAVELPTVDTKRETADLIGYVSDVASKRSIESVVIELLDANVSALTNSNGFFTLTGVPAGVRGG